MSRVASNGIHHANLLIGSSEAAEPYLCSLCDGLGIKLANNPDFFAFRMETFGIDEARELRLLSARKAVTTAKAGQAGRKIFLISSARLTLEAQNALLKIFEDPFPDTYFFLVVREEALIIPTLRSRLEAVRMPEGQTLRSGNAEEFLSLSLKDRLLFAKKFALEDMDLPVFLDNLLLSLKKRKETRTLLESVYNLRRFASDPAVLPRLVIEHLSLVLQ